MRFNPILFGLFLIGIFSCQGKQEVDTKQASILQNDNPMHYVDPFIGTGFHGHTFPGAVVPSGMVQLSPDTRINGWDASSGYHDSDSTILGFSHTHLSGTGIGDMGDLLVLPYIGERKDKMLAYYKKKNQQASPGYYRVKMDNNIEAELTTTTRSGMHRYTFPEGENRKLLFDITHILQVTWGCATTNATLEMVDEYTLKGTHISTGWAADDHFHFYAKFSEPILNASLTKDGTYIQKNKLEGTDLKAYFDFGKSDKPLVVKVGISAVSQEGAEKNLLAEAKDFDFDHIREEAKMSWSNILNRITIESKDQDIKKNFYTALYHANIQPMVYHDVDGKYRGMDKQIHESKAFTNYTVFSLWDTFRAFHPLMTILDEERASNYVSSLLQKYQEGGLLPKWPLLANYTGTMVGYPAVSVLADAYAKGIAKDDIKLALEAAIKSSEYHPEWIEGKIEKRRAQKMMPRHNYFLNTLGYVPSDSCSESVSYGLEYAYYDWCIAQIAKMAGEQTIYEKYSKRAQGYSQYFDKKEGFMRGKQFDGSWSPDFNPRYSKHEKSDFTEGNSWQWTWFVPHDVNGLKNLMGGAQNFENKLDTLFSTSSKIEGEGASGDITGLIGQYAHGNEPSHHITYLYNYIDRGYKTQEIVDSLLYHYYKPTPDGICGNEDVGQMSSWYILNAMGFYQVAPGDPTYTLGRPIIDRATIQRKDGTFEIEVLNNSKENKYIQEAVLNGKKLEGLFFSHKELVSGGKLQISMGIHPKQYN